MTRALVNAPQTARRGEIIEIRAMIAHPMETGYREGPNGVVIPRHINKRFVCTYDDAEIFSAELFPAISANPFLTFSTVATVSGSIQFEWTDDRDHTETLSVQITVT